MTEIFAAIYGFIQGITEFFPISSSGHLAMLPFFLEIKDPGVSFDVFMHLGTAMAVLIYFRKELLPIMLAFPKAFLSLLYMNWEKEESESFWLTRNILVATTTTCLLALFLKGPAVQLGRHVPVIAVNLVLFGILLYISDWWQSSKSTKSFLFTENQRLYAFILGVAQTIALFPGVSRSGITLTAALFLGANRNEATKFSFLLSLPIICAGAMLKSYEVWAKDSVTLGPLLPLVIGMMIAFVVGIFAIHFCLQLISKKGTLPFVIYRVVFGIALFLLFTLN